MSKLVRFDDPDGKIIVLDRDSITGFAQHSDKATYLYTTGGLIKVKGYIGRIIEQVMRCKLSSVYGSSTLLEDELTRVMGDIEVSRHGRLGKAIDIH